MANDFDIMCDEIYVDYKPIEPSEDYDPIDSTLYALGRRYIDILDNCCEETCKAYKPLELYFSRIFDDMGHFYEYMDWECELPEVSNVAELDWYYDQFYVHHP